MRLTRVVLPDPVPPTIAVVWPGSSVNEIRSKDRILRSRIPELDIAEFDPAGSRACSCRLAVGIEIGRSCVGNRWVRLEDLLDALSRCCCPRHHHEHHHGHRDREQDLHDVLQEGRQVADLHVAVIDEVATKPHDRDAGGIL